jgi:DNA-binding MurR/RpiR family transcriptional regulator
MGERQDQLVSTARGTARPDRRRPVSVLIKVRGVLPNLRPAERRVAEAVLADPAGISESSITAVARRCQTSETTVLRFCGAIGLAGYPELRIASARAAQFEEADHRAGVPMTGDITATDTLSDVVAKITQAAARAATDTATALDLGVLEAAIDAITIAPRIDLYGVGPSALVGQHLHQKLHRIGLVSFCGRRGS